ncbi:sn-glycerol-3-phosphate ABC transporter ATP-binding protein UgpC [Thiohalocapsa marina]|uniref:sn-glycerol-3-phosphate ABC transporter ATP-binding protein UgpC n=1 Tax=Thiohalocapsa marina TaxID=424902 RepID=A0A5M8FPC2_9GAMM|nr:sn-glycerol-3-phosphate ABC transporter ATP-binding protein UgpC [Thiohalocapsa marina]KAA6186748.1 sn-glycerol-3-phosphate ABC transporter ATP-binding protein UgpC [Thiohalocapsa marina]
MANIELDGIAKRYADGTEALKPTSLRIADGELFVLVGPSGCGKSTLLKLIVGLERPSAGEVRVGGERVTDRDPKDRNMAMVFQSYALYPHMSVRENMAFPLKLARLPKDAIERRVAQAAAMLELTDLLDRKPAALSGGQRQRVAMGRAIVREPAAFLLDEPLSNLDARLRTQMRAELAQLQRRLGTTTIYVTHDQTEAMTLGDRIAVLRGGEVQQVGSPRELYSEPANLFVASFIGSPPMNLMPARLQDGQLHLPMTMLRPTETLFGRLPAGDADLIVGIRPEHFDATVSGEDQPPGETSFEVRVEAIEWLGADLYLHFDVPAVNDRTSDRLHQHLGLEARQKTGLRTIARVSADTRINPGEISRLTLDPDRVLLFDARSGRRIAGPSIICPPDTPC